MKDPRGRDSQMIRCPFALSVEITVDSLSLPNVLRLRISGDSLLIDLLEKNNQKHRKRGQRVEMLSNNKITFSQCE